MAIHWTTVNLANHIMVTNFGQHLGGNNTHFVMSSSRDDDGRRTTPVEGTLHGRRNIVEESKIVLKETVIIIYEKKILSGGQDVVRGKQKRQPQLKSDERETLEKHPRLSPDARKAFEGSRRKAGQNDHAKNRCQKNLHRTGKCPLRK